MGICEPGRSLQLEDTHAQSVQPLRGSGWLLKAKSNIGNDAGLSIPAGTAPQVGQSLLELVPFPHGLLSPSGRRRVKLAW